MANKISLAGDLGSGKSTVADILINRLGAEYYSTGAIVRSIAARHNMSVVELNIYMETHPEIDTEIDNGLVELGKSDKCMVIDSRMAWHFTEGTFKVYLSTDVETSALRIMSANRKGEHSATLEQTVADTRARRESEKKRYKTQYGVDIKDLSNYSLIVDTTVANPEEVAECILSSYEEWQRDPSFSAVYISGERLNYPDDEADSERVAYYTTALDEGEEIPEVTVFEQEGEFYVDRGVEAALAHSFSDDVFFKARLVKGSPEGKKYVKMKNSL
jgi:predicted cytidylate kinase